MPHLPVLRVVPLESIRRHEEVDPLRVERLVGRIEGEGVQVNPMVCCRTDDGDYIVLDGATRTESLRALGLRHAVVQVVEPNEVTLETWHHVVRDCTSDDFLDAVSRTPDLLLSDESGTPGVHLNGNGSRLVLGVGLSANATLGSLVSSYIGRWRVSRVADPALDPVSWAFPDWSVVVEFPILTLDDVMKAATTEDLLPAGITRFLVHERALRLNVPLDLLGSDTGLEEKQEHLEGLIEERARSGRVRRYEETVFILDD
ncbi:MAG TPA: ParB N-terminal domain-containing protein [Acidimicrobiia bacterium]|nr:ParB N-terminal domain-containing protein [Acidimicrobiia bacterium]